MKVLITGGSGYLGQATIRAPQRHGHQAVALARSDDADRVVTDLGATAVRGGLTDLDVLHKTAIDVDAAIHLAQDYGPDTAGVDLRAATAIQDGLGSRPYVHTGGVWVYGNRRSQPRRWNRCAASTTRSPSPHRLVKPFASRLSQAAAARFRAVALIARWRPTRPCLPFRIGHDHGWQTPLVRP
jgi:nucleoside-diphosphate-sugar epimerase